MRITMDDSNVGVNTAPDGTKLLIVSDNKSGITIIVPLAVEDAKTIAAQLYSSLQIVGRLPENNHPVQQ